MKCKRAFCARRNHLPKRSFQTESCQKRNREVFQQDVRGPLQTRNLKLRRSLRTPLCIGYH